MFKVFKVLREITYNQGFSNSKAISKLWKDTELYIEEKVKSLSSLNQVYTKH